MTLLILLFAIKELDINQNIKNESKSTSQLNYESGKTFAALWLSPGL